MPPNHNLYLFSKGITGLSWVSGQEHRNMCRVLLGLIIDLRLPHRLFTSELVRCVHSLLDFLYLAQYQVHSHHTLDQLDAALAEFYQTKEIFIMLGARAHFKLPKLHNTGHYRYLIELYGTSDNYNIQSMERLHIEYAKDAYKATNWKDEFAHITLWLERKEKVLRHDLYMNWLTRKTSPPPAVVPHLQMTKNPTGRGIHFNDLADNYSAYDIQNVLAAFIAKTSNPTLSGMRLEHAASEIILFFNRLPVFHKVWFANSNPQEWLETDISKMTRHLGHSKMIWICIFRKR